MGLLKFHFIPHRLAGFVDATSGTGMFGWVVPSNAPAGSKPPSPPTDHTHPHANIHTQVGAGAGYVAAGGRGCCCGCVCLAIACTRCIAVRGLCGRPCAALGGHIM